MQGGWKSLNGDWSAGLPSRVFRSPVKHVQQRHRVTKHLFCLWVTPITQDNEVVLRVGVSRSRKTTNRNLVMNVVSRSTTHLALAARQPTGFVSRCLPSSSASVAPAASPSGMVFAPKILGLPFGHAKVVAEHASRVDVGSGAFNDGTAPRARRLNPVALSVPLAAGSMITCGRTEPTRLAAKRDRLAAHLARCRRSLCPLVFPLHADTFTMHGTQCQGVIEIDERWVDVAVKRLERWHAQGRLDFCTANKVLSR